MDSERWRRVELVYHSVLAYPSERRATVLEESCSGDPDLLRELKSLLEAREHAGSFLSADQLQNHIAELGSQPPGSLAGTRLGPYQIVAEIGAGSMGEVYRARDNRLDRELVLKILPPHLTHDAGRISRLRLEAKAAAALNHPNIVTVYEIGQVGDIWFIAQELIEGITLRERLAGGKLPLKEALDIAVQCSAALQTAHKSGILHRDIKPENIMLRCDGLVKMVDFGLARFTEAAPGCAVQTTQPGSIMGTPRYMSPEQARGQKLDSRSDIFSFGAVLYEMVEGRPAFPGATPAEVFAVLLGTEPLPTPPKFGTQLDQVLSKALERDRETRYQSMQGFANDLKSVDPLQRLSPAKRKIAARIGTGRGVRQAALAVSALLLAGIAFFFFLRDRPALTGQDSILLADFTNETGERVFDGTLKQGLAVQLEQSPRLSVFPEERVRSSLRLMRRSPDEPVTAQLGREICQREGLKAFVTGIIAPLGTHYVITLEAIGSQNGEPLARVQAEAGGKEKVLHTLSVAAADLREKLGESVHSIRKLDALLENTTGSLEALQAYSIGESIRRKGDFLDAIPFFRRALELDPDFVFGYAELATVYRNVRQPGRAAENATKAYALRDRASERERLAVMAQYYELVTGELEKRLDVLRVYESIYPRDPFPPQNLAVTYLWIGRYDEAVDESQKAMGLDPKSAVRFGALVNALVHLDRFAEAHEQIERARNLKLEDTSLHQSAYRLAFLNGDRRAMDEHLAWFSRRRNGYSAFELQALSAVYVGQSRQSAEYARRGIDSALKAGAPEVAADYSAEAALRSAAVEQCREAKRSAFNAVGMEKNAVSLTRAALALAWCGYDSDARMLVGELNSRYPRHTLVNGIWLPAIRAALELKRGRAQLAVDALIPAAPYEAAAEFWPQYLRGQAYLRVRHGPEGAAEFRNILDHRGQGVDSVLYPLAHLGLARAATLERDTAQARKSYNDFLKEWNDADTDLPQLLAARQELDKLKSTP